METKRICLWSGPRNVSTALMYSFAQRSDTRVVDEPLYAHYLRVSGAEHPGRDSILATLDPDGHRVLQNVMLGEYKHRVIFFKNMAHHLVDLDWGFLHETTNIILTRTPVEVLPSLARKLPNPDLQETGYPAQVEILDYLKQSAGDLVVLDARELLKDPESVLSQACERMGLRFEREMLHWPPGPRAEDGIWADTWYHDVHTTTGFAPYRPKSTPFPVELEPLLGECEPLYERLSSMAIKA